MKCTALILSVAAMAAAASAQTTAKPATTSSATATKKTVTTATKTTTATKATTAASADWWLKLPAAIPRVHGIVKTDFALRYEDIKIGTGVEAEPNKMYHVNYTGYLAATGEKFDSNSDRRPPVMKDGKPVMGPDGKPELGDPQPFVFAQGMRRGLIPGFDQGFSGMKIGGKRRIFIPWQLAYGTQDIPAHPPTFPGIPAKSDLIFDVELVDVTDMPKPPQRPQMPMRPPPPPGRPAAPGAPPAPGAAPATAPTPGTAPTAASPPATPAPATTTAPATNPVPTQPATAPKKLMQYRRSPDRL